MSRKTRHLKWKKRGKPIGPAYFFFYSLSLSLSPFTNNPPLLRQNQFLSAAKNVLVYPYTRYAPNDRGMRLKRQTPIADRTKRKKKNEKTGRIYTYDGVREKRANDERSAAAFIPHHPWTRNENTEIVLLTFGQGYPGTSGKRRGARRLVGEPRYAREKRPTYSIQ